MAKKDSELIGVLVFVLLTAILLGAVVIWYYESGLRSKSKEQITPIVEKTIKKIVSETSEPEPKPKTIAPLTKPIQSGEIILTGNGIANTKLVLIRSGAVVEWWGDEVQVIGFSDDAKGISPLASLVGFGGKGHGSSVVHATGTFYFSVFCDGQLRLLIHQ